MQRLETETMPDCSPCSLSRKIALSVEQLDRQDVVNAKTRCWAMLTRIQFTSICSPKSLISLKMSTFKLKRKGTLTDHLHQIWACCCAQPLLINRLSVLKCFIFREEELHYSKWLGFKLQTERLGSEQQAANVKISPHYTPLYCFSATQFVFLSKPFPTNNGSFCMRQPAATQKLKGFYYSF